MSASIWLVVAAIGLIIFLLGFLLSRNEPQPAYVLRFVGALVAIVGLIGFLVVRLA